MGTLMRYRETERTRSKAAATARRSAKTATALGRADGKSKMYGSRMMSGNRSSIQFKAIVHVRNLASHEDTTPFPFIMELMVEAKKALEDRTTVALIKRLYELQNELEPMAQMREDIASRGEPGVYRAALLHEAELQVEMATILEVLEERQEDYRHYRADGYRVIRPIRG